MNGNFEQSLALVLKHEGGFVNNPADPGGVTNLGVTKKVWEEWIGHPVTVDEMKDLTIEQITPLYKTRYWDAIKADQLPPGVDYALFDFAVNSGVGRAARCLQSCLGLKQDGAIGPQTLGAVEGHSAMDLAQQICENRLQFLQGLPTWNTFGRGWGRRVEEVEKVAMDMAAA